MTDINPSSGLKTLNVHINGMHCPNCDIFVERSLMRVPGVHAVQASFRQGRATITYEGDLDATALHQAVADEGYSVSAWDAPKAQSGNTARDYAEIGAAFAILLGFVFFLDRFELLPRGFGIADEMSYGFVLLVGLVASISSCMAVTGGLLVAIAAKYNEANARLSSADRLKPHLYFNAGRIISYTLLGGAVGVLGSALTLSPEINGILMLAASAIMIVLGLHMLKLIPGAARLLPALPRSFSDRIHRMAGRETKGGAFVLGATTFFLPCGFTQALQLYVLAKGSFTIGALTMLAFSIGTLPALLSLSAVSSFAKGRFQRHFVRIAGAAVVVLGLWNIQYGLTLISLSRPAAAQDAPTEEKQIVSMKIEGYAYIPNRFTVKQGVPVEWRIDAREAAGCGRVLIAPRLRIIKFLSSSATTVVTFTPDQSGDFAFNCSMGMMSPGSKFTVTPNDKIKT